MFDHQNYQKDYYIKNIRKFREYYHDNKDSIEVILSTEQSTN